MMELKKVTKKIALKRPASSRCTASASSSSGCTASGPGTAIEDPFSEENYVRTLRCADSALRPYFPVYGSVRWWVFKHFAEQGHCCTPRDAVELREWNSRFGLDRP